MLNKNTKYIDLTQLPFVSLNIDEIQALYKATNFREFLKEKILQAKSRIYIVALYLQNDEAGEELLRLIYQKKCENPNIEINIFVDWHRAQRGLIGEKKSLGNAEFYRKLDDQYKHKINIFGVPIKTKELLGVLHLKGIIIDDDVIYSGASLNNVYLAKNVKYRYDRYHVIKNKYLSDIMVNYINTYFTGQKAISSLINTSRSQQKLSKIDIQNFRHNLQHSYYKLCKKQISPNSIGAFPIVGFGKKNNKLNTIILNLILSSKSHVILCTPYFNFPISVKRALKKVMKNNIRVSIIVGDKQASDFYTHPDKPFKIISGLPYLYETKLRQYIKKHQQFIDNDLLDIHLWKDGDNSFHVKGIWSDNDYMLITGNNLNPRAWRLDLENGILFKNNNNLMDSEWEKEINKITQKTKIIKSYNQIDSINTYPPKIKTLLKRLKTFQADHVLNQLI